MSPNLNFLVLKIASRTKKYAAFDAMIIGGCVTLPNLYRFIRNPTHTAIGSRIIPKY